MNLGLLAARLLPGSIRRKLVEGRIRKWLKAHGAEDTQVTDWLAGYRTKLGAIGGTLSGIVLIINGITHNFDLKTIMEGVAAISASLAAIGIRFGGGRQ